jgi:hypothetical protein
VGRIIGDGVRPPERYAASAEGTSNKRREAERISSTTEKTRRTIYRQKHQTPPTDLYTSRKNY